MQLTPIYKSLFTNY